MFQALATLLVIVFPALVIVAALKDVTSFIIPNWISAALVVAFFPAALAAGIPLAQIGIAAAICAGFLVLGMGMFALNWIGGGDAKLMAAAALWLGPAALAPFVLITGLAGGALALSLVALRSDALRPLASLSPAWVGRLATRGGDVPYGVAIAIGALAAFPASLLPTALKTFV